jgi:hypothetical protein
MRLIRDELIGITEFAPGFITIFKSITEARQEFRQHGHNTARERASLKTGGRPQRSEYTFGDVASIDNGGNVRMIDLTPT